MEGPETSPKSFQFHSTKEFAMQDLINLPLLTRQQPTVALNAADEAGAPVQPKVTGVFLTHQSVITFPVASTIVTIIWQVLGRLYPAWNNNEVVAVVIALLVGGLLYWQSESSVANAKDRVLSIFYALLNAFTLAAAALGIGAVTGV
jgi:hypothetical protein